MALSIYYSGVLKEMNRLPELVAEVADICHDLHWTCETIDEPAPTQLNGLGFSAPGGEPVWLTFDSSGTLTSPYFALLEKPPVSMSAFPAQTLLETVVQYAGPDTHMRIVNLLQYISKKYFAAFELIDESEYWETGCEERCRDWFEMFACWQDAEHAVVLQDYR